ncbi:MAG: hypothetical protein AB8G86_03715 [Saprospiraceae bacterium]
MSASKDRIVFRFKSIGKKGIIEKGIWFQIQGENHYNLAFGDIINDNLEDNTISNNGDYIKVISTVANAINYFFKEYPIATLEINPIDKKRRRFYNTIFRRRHEEIKTDFVLIGINSNREELYNKEKQYEKW